MARTPAEIRDELVLFGLSGLDDLISDAADDCRSQPGKRNRTPECLLAEFLHDTLAEVKVAAERYIAVLADQEAQAERIAEEADLQYDATWSAFVNGITEPKGVA